MFSLSFCFSGVALLICLVGMANALRPVPSENLDDVLHSAWIACMVTAVVCAILSLLGVR